MVHKKSNAPDPIPPLRGGLAPHVERGNLTPDRIYYWANMPKCDGVETAALLAGLDPDYAHMASGDKKAKFADLRRLWKGRRSMSIGMVRR
jgi:hypothetical protein